MGGVTPKLLSLRPPVWDFARINYLRPPPLGNLAAIRETLALETQSHIAYLDVIGEFQEHVD